MKSHEVEGTTSGVYLDWAFKDVTMRPPLESLIGMVCARSTGGKSNLFQSCPDAFIFNMDLAGTTLSPCRASIWPAIDPATGNPVERSGNQMMPIQNFSFNHVMEKVELLIQMGHDGVQGRPKMIVMDTLDRLLFYVTQQYLADNKISRLKQAGNTFDAWDAIYTPIITLPQRFRNAGYGFWWTVQLGEKMVDSKGEQGRQLVKDRPLITDNLFSKIFPAAEVSAIVEPREIKEKTLIIIKDPVTKKPIMLPNGKPKTEIRVTSTERRVLAFDSREVIKRRGDIPPEIILYPQKDAWAIFKAAYEKAQQGEDLPPVTTETATESV